jgi:sugar lactone lactonase YvrE
MMEGHGDIVRVATGFKALDGIVWRRSGDLTFTDPQAEQIISWSPTSKHPPAQQHVTSGAAGLALDREGRLIVAERLARRVTRADAAGSTTLVDRVDGGPLLGPTDVALAPDGTMFVADVGPESGRVIRVSPDGAAAVAVTDVAQPAGLAVAPSGTTLYVSDAARSELRAYAIGRGALTDGRRLASILPWKSGVSGRPDGLLVDRAGHIFLAGPGGVWVLDENGGRLGVIAMAERPSASALGDPDGRTLYITAETSVYKIRLRKM